MAQKKIIWSETAARQRRSILEYWLQRNQSNAYSIKLLRLSNAKANQIAGNPMLYKTASFPNTHVATMGHFSLFYKITDEAILITAFWDNRQDPKKLLELLRRNTAREAKDIFLTDQLDVEALVCNPQAQIIVTFLARDVAPRTQPS